VQRRHVELWAPALDASGVVLAYGHWGRPVLVFPTEGGRAWEYETGGMVAAIAGLIEAGRVKLYCVDSYDAASWSNAGAPLEERARAHGRYETWILDQVVPWIHGDCRGAQDILATGCSLGAYHAVHLALQRADLVPLAIGLSGNYDVSTWRAWGDRGDATYFANPVDYVAHAEGDHLQWLREHVSILLVCGQGAWEVNPTGALPSTRRMAQLLQSKGIRCELDLWGYDVAHDWPWWQRQLAHHLPRFC